MSYVHLYDTALTAVVALVAPDCGGQPISKLATLSTAGCFKMHPRDAPRSPHGH